MSFINQYFDEIYLINLKRRPDRLLKVLERTEKLGIELKVIEAIDGRSPEVQSAYHKYVELPMDHPNAHELQIKYNRKMIDSAGGWAYLLTHLQIIKYAKLNGYKRILCLDDDALFHKEFNDLLEERITEVPQDWKLLYLGATQHQWKFPVAIRYRSKSKSYFDPHEKYYHPLFTDGSFAVGIDVSIFDLIEQETKKMNCAFDSGPLRKVMQLHQEKCFVLQPNLIIADVSESDIRLKRNQIELSSKLKWTLGNYDTGLSYDLISVIMPAYNAESTIELSINSILNQDYPNLELIVADDGSSDDTLEVVRRISQRDPRVKLIHNISNRGCYFVRNDAVRMAKGEFIAIQDADDFSLPNRLSMQVAPFYHSSCKVTIGKILRTHISPEEVAGLSHIEISRLAEERRLHKNRYGNYEYCCRNILGFMTTMYHRSVFEEIGLFWEEKHSMDMEYLERLWFHQKGRLFYEDENVHTLLSNTDYIEEFFALIDSQILFSFQMGENNITHRFKTRKKNSLIPLWRKRLRNKIEYKYPQLNGELRPNNTGSFVENQDYVLGKLKLCSDKQINLINSLREEIKCLTEETKLLQSLQEQVKDDKFLKGAIAPIGTASIRIKELEEVNAKIKKENSDCQRMISSCNEQIINIKEERDKEIKRTRKWHKESYVQILKKLIRKIQPPSA